MNYAKIDAAVYGDFRGDAARLWGGDECLTSRNIPRQIVRFNLEL
jgi:hypothetical protein